MFTSKLLDYCSLDRTDFKGELTVLKGKGKINFAQILSENKRSQTLVFFVVFYVIE